MLNKTSAFDLIGELRSTGVTFDREGTQHPFIEFFGGAAGQFLFDLVRQIRPTLIIELGLAHATSALYMLEALRANGAGTLVSIDPLQESNYRNLGRLHIERAQLSAMHSFFNGASELILPQLVQGNHKCEFAFVDSNHQYDQTIVEGYYLDRLLRVGGLMIFDDYGLSSVKTACNFFETNRHYRVIEETPLGRTPDGIRVLQKTADDDRFWFHFVPFAVAQEDQTLWRLTQMKESLERS